MIRLLTPLAIVACIGWVHADDKPKGTPKPAAFDAAKMLGEWTYESGVKAGEKVPKDHLQGKVKITKDRLTIPSGMEKPFVMAYKLDTKNNPVTIDMEIKEGPMPDGKAKGIVAVDGDTLKICYHPTGGARPTKFESTKENDAFYFVLKRAK